MSYETMYNIANQIVVPLQVISEEYEARKEEFHPSQKAAIEFQCHHLHSLRNRFKLRGAVPPGSMQLDEDDILEITTHIGAILHFNQPSSPGLKLWKATRILSFEFAVNGVRDLKRVRNMTMEGVKQVQQLGEMISKGREACDVNMDDSMLTLMVG